LLAAGDSALVKLPTDSIFAGHEAQRPPFLAKGSSINFVLRIEKIQSLDEAMAERNAAMEKAKAEAQKVKVAEIAGLEKYIADNKLVVTTTPSGLRYKIVEPTTKRKPLNGDTVYVNYIGRTLDGKVFDSSIEAAAKAGGLNQPGRAYEPIQVVLGQGQVIKGWDQGLLLLNEGSKATFIIPSALAYGERAAGPDIGPYATLVFDLELVKVKPGKHPVVKPGAKKGIATKKYVKKKTTATTKK
jgi:FKBP-type peptidyl-prolyl cis-trans isomerase